MAGSKLHQFLKILSASESMRLISNCQRSQDIRHKQFSKILKGRPYELSEDLELHIEHIIQQAHPKISNTEKRNKIRRLISFCCQEIESLKILDYYAEEKTERSIILSKILFNQKNKWLSLNYLSPLLKSSNIIRDKGSKLAAIDLGIRSISQTDESFEKLNEYLALKKETVSVLYHTKISEYYGMLSNLYINDTRSIETPIEEQLEGYKKVISAVSNYNFRIDYELSCARFVFDQPSSFKKHIEAAYSILSEANSVDPSFLPSKRKIIFTDFLIGYHLGEKTNTLLDKIKEVNALNEKLGFPDILGYFYYLFIQILSGKGNEVLEELKENKSLFKNNDLDYLESFLKCCIYFDQNNKKDFIKTINSIEIRDNYYIKIWSRLLELCYWVRKKDDDFSETLYLRLKKELENNQGKKFTLSDNLSVLEIIKARIHGGDSAVLSSDLNCIYHQWLVERI